MFVRMFVNTNKHRVSQITFTNNTPCPACPPTKPPALRRVSQRGRPIVAQSRGRSRRTPRTPHLFAPSKPRLEDAIRDAEPEPHHVDREHGTCVGDVDHLVEGISAFFVDLIVDGFVAARKYVSVREEAGSGRVNGCDRLAPV